MIQYNYTDSESVADAFSRLYEIISLLRTPEGCPWDREQTESDVIAALQDESYEYLDALHENDIDNCKEELGDIALNLAALFRIHEEKNEFTPIESINTTCKKLIRRHPHVFDEATANTSTEVLELWNKVKEDVEGIKASETDFFSRVPKSLPPLEESWEIQKKVKKVGFDWPDVSGVLKKTQEEYCELTEAIASGNTDDMEEELGDLLFVIVNLARFLGVRPTAALRRTNQKIRKRFNAVQSICIERKIPLDKDHFQEMDAIWDEVKAREKSR